MSNGSSYQQFDGPSESSYEDIETGSPRRKFTKPAVALAALGAVVLAVYYGMTSVHGSAQRAVDKQISTNTNVKVKPDGKLRLFDELGKLVPA